MNDTRRGLTRERIYSIIRIGNTEDVPSRAFDILIALSILVNLFIIFFETFDASAKYIHPLSVIELVTVIIFTVEYILRIITADYEYPREHSYAKAVLAFVLSLGGIIDLASFIPYWLSVLFTASIVPQGAVAFRMLRVVRIFRLFRINRYYDAFNVISDVLREKKNQIISALFIMVMLVIGASLIMYDIEHAAQPDVFRNAFSGIWWAVSTLLTVGYGDIYPITDAGRIVGIILAFLGVGIVAIPTGIISAGFVQQYTRIKDIEGTSDEYPIGFITVVITAKHEWLHRNISGLPLPEGMNLLAVLRGSRVITASEGEDLREGDRVIVGSLSDNGDVAIEEVTIGSKSEWCNAAVAEFEKHLNAECILIKRDNGQIIPAPDSVIICGDVLVLLGQNMSGD